MTRIITILSLFFLFACGGKDLTNNFSNEKTKRNMTSSLDGSWSVSDKDQSKSTTPNLVKPEFHIDETEKRISGTTGCNRYFGAFETDEKGGVSISNVALTKMYCAEPKGIMEAEQNFVKQLSSVNAYEVKKGVLHLYSESELIFTLEQSKE